MRAWSRADPKHAEGVLESVYFDDASLTSFREKRNGDGLKRKVRVRWYDGAAVQDGRMEAFLEIKDRIGSARRKQRVKFLADAALLKLAPLNDGRFVGMLRRAAEENGLFMPEGLVPTVSIRYARSRFVCPVTGSRVSLDYALECRRANADRLPFLGPLRAGFVLVEAKSNQADSWPFAEGLARMGFRLESFSKYGFFVERILNGGCA